MKEWIGIDIGGTKLAVVRGDEKGRILEKKKTQTANFSDWQKALSWIADCAMQMKNERCQAVGISCGGPLDSRAGLVLSPPNLPGWDKVPVVKILEEKLLLPVSLQNDADACALAEWKYGAGRGSENMIFCTFGTGMGAGLILDGRLYTGRNNGAGEIGHMRMQSAGPVGFGKEGSFEGFCSGGGMAQTGRSMAMEELQMGRAPLYCRSTEELSQITAKSLAEAARAGDRAARKVFRRTGEKLGEGLAVMMDILNPDCIVLGSVFVRCEDLLRPAMEESIKREALESNRCPVLPAALGEKLGDVAALSVAQECG